MEVNSKITIKFGDKTLELSRAEAMELQGKLAAELGIVATPRVPYAPTPWMPSVLPPAPTWIGPSTGDRIPLGPHIVSRGTAQ